MIVSKDGSGNFTTIGEAVAVSTNNTRPEDGYFVIYAKQGLYEEYIVIPSYKRNILLLGDGINATVITGNHSVIDGWTTYNSSTFGMYKHVIYINIYIYIYILSMQHFFSFIIINNILLKNA